MIESIDDDDVVQHSQRGLCSCCNCHFGRCASHAWFLMACCGFVLISSLPRILTIVDFVTTIFIYTTVVCPPEESVWSFLAHDFKNYNFRTSAISVLILALLRSIILFFAFAYRFHLVKASFYISTTVMTFSTLWITLKIILNSNPHILGLLIFSLLITLGEYGIYMALRRRRIAMPSRTREETVSPGKAESQYHRLTEDGQPPPTATPVTVHDIVDGPTTVSVVVEDGTDVDPIHLADPDSLFIDIDSLTVHYKLAINGQQVMPQYTSVSHPYSPPHYDDISPLHDTDHKEPPPLHHSNSTSSTTSTHAPHGHVVILLHGFGGSTFSWRKIWNGLMTSTTAVMAFDRPGFGLTSRPVPNNGSYGSFIRRDTTSGASSVEDQLNPYSQQYSVRLLIALMDRLGMKTAVLVGHSTGGAIALRAAMEYPNRITGTILISPHIYSEGFPDLVRSMFKTRLGKTLVLQLVRSEIGEVAIRRAWYDHRAIPKDVIDHYQRILRCKHWHEAIIEMASTSDPPHTRISKQLDSIKVPVFILHGDHDKLVSWEESEKAVKKMHLAGVQATFFKIDSCGHVPHEEFPELMLAYLHKLLSQIDSEMPSAIGSPPIRSAIDSSSSRRP